MSGLVTIDFILESHWLRMWRKFLDQSRIEVKQNQRDPGVFPTLN